MKALAPLIFYLICTSVVAQGTVNGCGAGITAWLTPDSIPVIQCKFVEACNVHDVCYGRCEGLKPEHSAQDCAYLKCKKGGKLYGTAPCETDVSIVKSLVAAADRRTICDCKFKDDLLKRNLERPACKAFAEVYYRAAQFAGDKHFAGVRPTGLMVLQSRAEYDEVLSRFFREASDDQFDAVVTTLQSNSGRLNLRAALQFSKDTGLSNKP